MRAAQGDVRQVEAEEPAGAAGDDVQQAVEVVGEGQVAGGVGEGVESGLAARVLGAFGVDLPGEDGGPLQAVEVRAVEAAAAGLVEEGASKRAGGACRARSSRTASSGSAPPAPSAPCVVMVRAPVGRAKSGTSEETRPVRRN